MSPGESRPHPSVAVLLVASEAISAAASALAIIVLVAGRVRLGSVQSFVRVGNPSRAAAIGVLALAVSLGMRLLTAPRTGRIRDLSDSLFRVTCLTVLAAVFGTTLSSLVTTCGGLDSAGYVGAAQLLLHGRITEEVPIARLLPFAGATAAASPLGWVAAAQPFHIAPEFPLGLPLVMAVFGFVGGRSGPFYVAPLLGAGTVVLAYLIPRRRTCRLVGTITAVLFALSPIVVDLSLQPMSDVPAAFWVALTAYALWGPSPRVVPGAVAGGMAMLTRPPLILAVAALAMVAPWRSRAQAVRFGLIELAFAAALMVLQWRMFGNPLTSGHGAAQALFTFAAFPHNVVSHAKWLLTVHTPLLLIAFVAGALYDPRFALRATAVFLAVAAPYLFYAVRFDDWEMIRFLLPGIVFLCAVCASGIGWLRLGDPHGTRARLAATGIVVAAAAGSFTFLSRQHVFELWRQEDRYKAVGEWFASHAMPGSVALASLHSGSLKYYSERPVVRLDAVPDDSLLATIRALQQAGYRPYLVLEQGAELEGFYERFRPQGIASLKLDPQIRIGGVYIMRLSGLEGDP